MATRSCAHHKCGQEFTSIYPQQKYCNKRCQYAGKTYRWRQANPDKWRKIHDAANKKRYYNHVAPRGQRLQHLLDLVFRSQASRDPSGLPQLASRVLSWRPKGYSEAIQYAKHPHGPLERDWLWYSELHPDEAVVIYEREA